MTRSQFAWAIRSDEKWLENASRLLAIRLRYDNAEAKSLGVVRLLNHEFDVPLERAVRMAASVLRAAPATRELRVSEAQGGIAALVLDVARFHSSYAAALSAAICLGGPRRRGRPSAALVRLREKSRGKRANPDALVRARTYGVDVELLREGLKRSASARLEELDRNAAFIRDLRRATRAGRPKGSKAE